ncbi:MAG: tRNA preQ1(34) S-adenosylmethionine ribosyltransferase-isomerase QueA [Planctomycetes bacterium]|nr:tRNA preQ1(34) S-adenosylmethionine ribosyltransferase-isomerase QueA [Planctomycetota bacterium]
MRSDTFDFEIPIELIAQTPAARRDESRLMVVRRQTGAIEHRVFRELPDLMQPQDLLVLNDTQVQPNRLFTKRESSGGTVELFLLRKISPGVYEAITGSGGKLTPGEKLRVDEQTVATLEERDFGGAAGHWRVEFIGNAQAALAAAAKMPLPPYIKREKGPDAHDAQDRERYQTVFAKNPGAVAAPTAGLHFTPELLAKLNTAFLTLHVGEGTFRPLKADTLAEHVMHAEPYEIGEAAVGAVQRARVNGGRVIAVGTTCCRTLETVADERGMIAPGRGETALFIYPPYRFRAVDGLLTNFHLPRSTLIFLVAALMGVELTRRAYLEAIAQRYRFFSYGDAMLIL